MVSEGLIELLLKKQLESPKQTLGEVKSTIGNCTMKNKNFLDWNYGVLARSLKRIDLNIILIVILDALFYLASVFIYINWFAAMKAKEASFSLPPNIQSLPLSQLQQLTKDAQSFYYFFILSFLLVVISVIFLASISKGIIWAKTTRTKITLKLISKFFMLNLAWMGFWFLAIMAIAKFVDAESVNLFSRIAIFLGIYLTGALYSLFMKEQKFRAVKDALKLSIRKIHMFILPYFLISLVLYILVKLTSQFPSLISTTILLIYIAIVRYYLSELAFELKKH